MTVGQSATIISKDRNLAGKTVRVLSVHDDTLSEDKNDTRTGRWYKVTADWIGGHLAFYEEQLT